MIQPGPCAVCGRENYPLSYGGPTICPARDCGPCAYISTINNQKLQLEQLRKERMAAITGKDVKPDTWYTLDEGGDFVEVHDENA